MPRNLLTLLKDEETETQKGVKGLALATQLISGHNRKETMGGFFLFFFFACICLEA